MPKDTFFRISEERRNRIIKAAEDEFARATLDNAKVSNIVRNSKISRGSFYQYFDDIQDAFYYVAESFYLLQEQEFIKLLRETNGDIFKAVRLNVINNFSDMVDKKTWNLYRNIHISINKNNLDPKEIISKLKEIRQEIISYIEDYKNDIDKEALLFILKDIQWRIIHKSFKDSHKLEKALKELDLSLNIVKHGVI